MTSPTDTIDTQERRQAVVHLSVSADRKARWVRDSRAAGLRLTDWIIDRVERDMPALQLTTILIPPDLGFADLRLARDPDGHVSLDLGVIERIELASGLPAGYLAEQGEDALSALLTQWYRSHLAAGGAPDPVQEDLIAEARTEDERGGGLSHTPGRA